MPAVDVLFEVDWRWLVLQACHLEGFHDDFVMVAGRACLTVVVQTNNLYSSCLVTPTWYVLYFVLNRNLCAGTQLLDELASRVG